MASFPCRPSLDPVELFAAEPRRPRSQCHRLSYPSLLGSFPNPLSCHIVLTVRRVSPVSKALSCSCSTSLERTRGGGGRQRLRGLAIAGYAVGRRPLMPRCARAQAARPEGASFRRVSSPQTRGCGEAHGAAEPTRPNAWEPGISERAAGWDPAFALRTDGGPTSSASFRCDDGLPRRARIIGKKAGSCSSVDGSS